MALAGSSSRALGRARDPSGAAAAARRHRHRAAAASGPTRAAAPPSPPPQPQPPAARRVAAAAARGRRGGGGGGGASAGLPPPRALLQDAPPPSAPDAAAAAPEERVGVLLLNLGGPETLSDVQPFLFNLFADPDIIRLPAWASALQRPLAGLISTLRAPKSAQGYSAIGGGSPLRRVTDEQAAALAAALASKGTPAHVYVAMRYWLPFTEEAVAAIKRDRITSLVVLPLYPQFSISTSGSSLRLLESLFRADPYLSGMKHTVIPSWYNRPGYVSAMAGLIETALGDSFPGGPGGLRDDATVFFSAHGVPESYVREAGDPYKEEVEQCVALIMEELGRRGVPNPHTLAYQSRVGPVEWLKPYTDATIRELGAQGCPGLLAVPISFVSEHIETLEEIDVEYRELARDAGIPGWGRVPALGTDAAFIGDLADAVLEALPYAEGSYPAPLASAAVGGTASVAPATCPGGLPRLPTPGLSSLVPLGSVEDLLATYDGDRVRLPLPVDVGAVWRWGWTRSAEVWNGRLAMLCVFSALALELTTGRGVLSTLGLM